ncbi:MAG: hypothetical protein QNJ54_29435 [Prochloraceae cyanobacterium]|nr:hypothetical protein [Prochloraceae cyanobacterium]
MLQRWEGDKLKIVVRRSWTHILNSRLFYWGFCLESIGLFLWLNSLDISLLIVIIKLFASIQAIGSFIVFIICHTNVHVYGDWRGEKAARFLRIHQKLDELREDLLSGDEDKKQEYWKNLELLADFSDFD